MNQFIYTFIYCCLFSSAFSQQYGEIDLTFNPYSAGSYFDQSGFNGAVNDAVQVDADEYIAVGAFTQLHGQPCNKIAKINATLGYVDFFPQHTISNDILFIEKQSNGKLILAGYFTTFDGIDTRIIRLNEDGSLDLTFNSQLSFTGSLNGLTVDGNDNIYVIGDQMYFNNTPHNGIMRLLPNGNVDPTFNTNGGANGIVNRMEMDGNGSIFLQGVFSYFGITNVNGYVKILPNGQVDNSFATNLTNVTKLKPAPNGTVYAVINNSTIKRLFADGTVDNTFVSPMINNTIHFLLPQVNNSLRVYGQFITAVAGVPSDNFFQLSDIGAVETGFSVKVSSINSIVEVSNDAYAMCGAYANINNNTNYKKFAIVQHDGGLSSNPFPFGIDATAYYGAICMHGTNRIAVGFSGTDISSQVSNFALYQLDGAIDSSFMSNIGTGPDGYVRTMKSLSNGKLLIAGGFGSVNSISSVFIAKLNVDGTVDTSFHPPLLDAGIESIDVQSDGKILIAGYFQYVNNQECNYIARLNEDGSVDPSFQSPLIDGGVFGYGANVVKCGANDKIYVGGKFACCNNLVRMFSAGTIDYNFNTAGNGPVYVYDIEEMNNGKVLFCGELSDIASSHKAFYYRTKINGAYDGTFNAYVGVSPSSPAYDIEPWGDNLYIVSGNMSSTNMYNVIDEDGNVLYTSESFINQGGIIFDAAIQADGKMVAIGSWDYLNDVVRNHVARLNNYTVVKDTLCSNSPFNFGSYNLTQLSSGFYYDTIPSVLQSDSIVLLDLYVLNSSSLTISANGSTLYSTCSNCLIQWFNCSTNSEIPGANSNTYNVTIPGSYAAIIQSNGCTDTTNCIPVGLANLNEYQEQNYTVFPNPTSGTIIIRMTNVLLADSFIIYDLLGRIFQKGTLKDTPENQIELELADGTYIIELFSNQQSVGKTCVLKK